MNVAMKYKRIMQALIASFLCMSTLLMANDLQLSTSKGESMDIETFYKNKNRAGIYRFTLANGVEVTQSGSVEKHFNETRHDPKNPLLEENRAYYGTGELWVKGQEYLKRFDYGISYTYDKEGNVTKEVNHDEGFTYTWEDLQKYILKHHIDLLSPQTYVSKRTREIMLDIYEGKNSQFINPENILPEKNIFTSYEKSYGKVYKLWFISYEVRPGTLSQVFIDAANGKLIYRIELPVKNSHVAYYDKEKGAIHIDKSHLVQTYKDIDFK